MQTYSIDGKTVHVWLEQAAGGGMLINAAYETGDGSWKSYRHWFSSPTHARQVYDGLGEVTVRQRIAKAEAMNTAGSATVTPIAPIGWSIVPTQLTPEMKVAFTGTPGNADAKYGAALAAAPQPPDEIPE